MYGWRQRLPGLPYGGHRKGTGSCQGACWRWLESQMGGTLPPSSIHVQSRMSLSDIGSLSFPCQCCCERPQKYRTPITDPMDGIPTCSWLLQDGPPISTDCRLLHCFVCCSGGGRISDMQEGRKEEAGKLVKVPWMAFGLQTSSFNPLPWNEAHRVNLDQSLSLSLTYSTSQDCYKDAREGRCYIRLPNLCEERLYLYHSLY